MGRSVVSNEDKKALKLARKEGRLAEAMLDRRAKLKRYNARLLFKSTSNRIPATDSVKYILTCNLYLPVALSITALFITQRL
jgi:hypothetical protein